MLSTNASTWMSARHDSPIASPTADFGTITLLNSNQGPSPSPYLGFLASIRDVTLAATTAAVGFDEQGTVYPNPARRMATLRLPGGTDPAPLTLTDARGCAVRRYPAPTGSRATLDLRGLPAGLYLLRGARAALRVVVE